MIFKHIFMCIQFYISCFAINYNNISDVVTLKGFICLLRVIFFIYRTLASIVGKILRFSIINSKNSSCVHITEFQSWQLCDI
jgi:hypothetical protein